MDEHVYSLVTRERTVQITISRFIFLTGFRPSIFCLRPTDLQPGYTLAQVQVHIWPYPARQTCRSPNRLRHHLSMSLDNDDIWDAYNGNGFGDIAFG